MASIGLLTTGLWHSFSRELFEGVRAEAERLGMTLVVFLGNELRSRSAMTGLPELGNSIYRLVSSRRLDGLVVWTGNLGNYVEKAELEDFLQGFDLPVVTIGRRVLDFPNIIQDEEAGARRVMDHLLDHHGAKRLFFLRGPASHPGCEFRYQGYLKSLQDRKIRFDPDLVAPPLRGWEDTNSLYLSLVDHEPERTPRSRATPVEWLSRHPEAQNGLFLSVLAERGLVPGRDFDTVVAATDVLAAIAIRQLSWLGCAVPSDVRVAGLDGDEMAHDILPLALSTLPLNLAAQGAAAVSRLAALIRGNLPPEFTFTVSEPVWGTSCGCLPAPFGTGPGISLAAEQRLKAVLQEDSGQEKFLELWIRETRLSPPQPGMDATDRMRFLWALHPLLAPRTRQTAEAWVQQAIAEGRALASRQRERKMKVLFDIGQSLSSRFDRESMVEALVSLLPRIGLGAFSLALYRDPLDPTAGLNVLAAVTRAGFDSGTLDSNLLAPDRFFDGVRGRSIILEPLYASGGLLGILLLEHSPGFDAEFYHHVGTQVSASLRGALLKEEVTANLETLNQAQLNLREKEKLAVLGGLAAGVVHEVNTPLGAIISVNGVLESLTAELVEKVAAAAPFLPPLGRSVSEFLSSLPPSGAPEASRAQRKVLNQSLLAAGVDADEAAEQTRFLGEQGLDGMPGGWPALVGGPGGQAVFRLIEALTDIRRTAAINKRASTKMESYLKAIRSYIYRDRDHESSSRVDLCQTLDTVLTLNASKLRGVTAQRRYRHTPVVDGWSEALIQVWNNLVSNALFAMGDAGVLSVEVSQTRHWATVRISDTGPGIPPEIQGRVFEDFFTTKPIGIGTGLGLGIVRQIVHDHRGTIEFESGPGRTTFVVKLPALDPTTSSLP